jgi:Zn-dependent M28 family amino/carboxypeptidase
MKFRTKLLLTLTSFAGLVGMGVVHTTSFPAAGRPGAAPAGSPDRETLVEELREHLRYQTIGVGQRQAARDGASWALVDYISGECSDLGFEPELHEYRADNRTHQNVIVQIDGRSAEIVLVCCHYDAYTQSPSAAASASGTAALLEVLERAAGKSPEKTLRFAFFSTGEAPYRGTEDMGSRQYAKACKERNESIAIVLALDSFAHFSAAPDSQSFLFPWSFAFPKTGDFAVVAGGFGDRAPVKRVLTAWATGGDMPARGLAVTPWLARLRHGDQEAFRAEGFPAVLVTDTGVNRFEDLRTRFDTFDRIDYAAMARAVEGLTAAVLQLAGA